MRAMKKLSLLLALAPVALRAQVHLENERIVKVRRNVEVSFDVRADKGAVRGPYRIVCTPCLLNGADTVWLEPFEVFSRTSLRRERQDRLLLYRQRDWQPGPLQMLHGSLIAYTASIPYERWMRSATLSYRSEIVGCDRCKEHAVLPVAEEIQIYVPPVPELTDVETDPQRFEVVDVHRRWEFRNREMKIDFPVSRTELNEDFFGNRQALDEIVKAVRGLQARRDRHLSQIEIYGFASPEGSMDFNERLAAGRAEALREYIRRAVSGLSGEMFRLVNGVENWDGLRRMVADSQMPGREEVLDVIDSVPVEQGRKSRLMALRGGDTYRYMLREFYPLLRNACYVSVYYDVLEDTAAVRINEAHGLIREGRYADALRLLERVDDDPRAYNAVGVCHMMLEEEDEAAEWFEKAIAAGCEEARENLDQIR